MIKNLNDLVSLLVLVIACIFGIRLLVWINFRNENETEKVSRWQIIKEYNDNIEE